MVERLFLAVPRGCLQFVIVVFPDQTHLLLLLGRMDIMTTVKSKLLVDSQNSFLVYHFKSLNLVQNSAMNETFITIAGH